MVTTKTKWIIGAAAVVVVVGLGVGLGVGLKSSAEEEDKEPETEIPRKFPENFKFGAASAAYQVEGASTADGKGPNIWDDFVKQEGRIDDGSSTDDGPDSYLNYKDDVKILKDIGMQFYRFSISWSRVMADGTMASVNEAGLQYYDNLINELLANGMEPMVTMYHWDLPSGLQNLGGLVNPLIANYFEDYATLLYSRYGDRVKTWITFNEPIQFCPNGYGTNEWAPGIAAISGEYLCAHNVLVAHAKAYHAYKDKFAATQKGRVGITLDTSFYYPKDPNDPRHVEAAQSVLDFQYNLFTYPIFIGGYPERVRTRVDKLSEEQGYPWSRLPVMDEETKNLIKGTSDFLGLNYYTSLYALPDDNPGERPLIWNDRQAYTEWDPAWPRAKSTWLYSNPNGLKDLLIYIKNTFNGVETIITENGWSDDGQTDDGDRVEYLRLHLNAILDAIDEGANVTGHTTWCLVDNFEWLRGYTEKFGIHTFDATTKERKPKKSVTFLRDVVKNRFLPEKVPTTLFP